MLPAVLRDEPQFRLFFLGQAASVLGDRITFVALPFAVLSVGGGAAQVGLVGAATTVPFLVLSLLGGVWADRLPRHRVMLASDLVRLAVQLVAALLLLTGAAEVWHLVLIGVAFGSADAFFQPAATGLMPVLLPAERLQEANALRSLVMSSSLVLGPAIAAGLIALLDPGGAILLDAVTFAVSAAALMRLRPPVRAAAAAVATTATGVLAEVRGGWEEVRARPWVQGFLLGLGLYSFVVLPAIFALGPVLADEELDGASSWALITAAFGIGCILGDLLILRHKPARPLVWAALGLTLGAGQAAFIGSGLGTWGIAALELVAGVGVTAAWGLWETALQVHVPEHAISRVSSFDYLVTVGGQGLGLAVAGPVAELVGLHTTLLLQSALVVPVVAGLLLVPSVRELSSSPSPAAVPGTP